MSRVRVTLLGVGAMNSPRYRPAGAVVSWRDRRVMLDGGGSATPGFPVHAWLVTDIRAELMPAIRRTARALGLEPAVAEWRAAQLRITPMPVEHTSHETYGYLVAVGRRRIVWAPEFWTFPDWAAGADLMFADAAGWHRPIRFAGGVGGHSSVLATAEEARRSGVGRLVFAHIGRPAIRARDAGQDPPYGEWGIEDRHYYVTA